MASQPRIRLGTRGSPLALAQANEVKARLLAAHDDLGADDVEIRIFRTTGDRIRDRSLKELGGKGLFTKEIEDALLAGEVDLAVHSMKDVPTVLPDGLAMTALLPREDPRDAFLSPVCDGLTALPEGAVVGTSSLRRAAQVRHRRPDVQIVEFRGNVDTRLRKLSEGVAQATLLACAGLNRLDLAGEVTAPVPVEVMLPAVAQGAIGLESRADDAATFERLRPLNHIDTADCIAAERALLAALDGSCRTPIAALATLDGDALWLRAEILRPDGSEALATERRGARADAAVLGDDAGDELRRRAGPGFFDDG